MPRCCRFGLVLGLAGLFVAAAAGLQRPSREVAIKNMQFNPAAVYVKVGEIVRWTNQDDRDHTVTAENGSFKSANLRSGERFEHKFDQTGTFPYSCSYHPRMKGTVNVSK